MNSNIIKERHRYKKYMILWNFGDLFTCEDTDLIIIDEYQAICRVSERIFELTPREIKVI